MPLRINGSGRKHLRTDEQLNLAAGFTLPLAAVYGVFTGLFVGRAARLWRLALRPAAQPALAA